jgi:carbohydrate kinase (thermoresistant glucokinase family)
MVTVIMGVSGTGKTTIGKLLAKQLSVPFIDADDFHPKSNVDKMKSGVPLNDDDRLPWLLNLRKEIESHNSSNGAVLACSALKKKYREILSKRISDEVRFVWLMGDKKTILNRMNQRDNHYMPSSLLDSQFDALEEPSADEAITVEINATPDLIVEEILKKI